ncbi:hypothetical protein PGTUg99_036988 [Puccinia graminis f. sp. tritici]|uniref:Uncharacterized protein n=1 Tax=Puccinia graminis f. sp. tritici TaxID=56615 RepID=A0A5B0NLR1_PUCGR|nr:hypothetical protein PGTUg99_036988 [Puccinia graminis f. sp. tritici]
MWAGHNTGSGNPWIGLGDTDTKFPRGSYRIAPADPNHLINRDWIGKTIRSRYTVLGYNLIRSPINTDPGIGLVTSLLQSRGQTAAGNGTVPLLLHYLFGGKCQEIQSMQMYMC